MSEKELRCSRYIENFNPPQLIEKLVHEVCKSVADAFLGQIEYGRDYVVSTELVKESWADGFGTKYTYNLKFDEFVRCIDCRFSLAHGNGCGRNQGICDAEPDGFCKWGERQEK